MSALNLTTDAPESTRGDQAPAACATSNECDDGNPCILDNCAEGKCVHTDAPFRTPCPDGIFCNGEEFCSRGQCRDAPDPCEDLAHCDENNDRCLDCIVDSECLPDGNFCTVDACVEGTCYPPMADGTPCSDDIFCNGMESCLGGSCIPGDDFCGDPAFPVCDECNAVCAPPIRGVIFVDGHAPGPIHDGMRWCSAFPYLQDALAASRSGDTIRVAEGTYTPDRGAGQILRSRTATFQLKNGVRVEGGYAGFGAVDPDVRDIAANATILSGDLNGDDAPVVCTTNSPDCDSNGSICGYGGLCIIRTNNVENSYHVVTASGTDATAVIEGFTITSGNANSDNKGAGIYNHAGSPTVTQCTLKGNSAQTGGGMSNLAFSNPTVTNCTFSGNTAVVGGGMQIFSSSATLTNCTFRENSADGGGGIENTNSMLTAANCVFRENLADEGGGIDNPNSRLTVTSCTFIANTAVLGGGLHISGLSPTLTGCSFNGNAALKGGGIYSFGSERVTNCTFTLNSVAEDGGGIYNIGNVPTVSNCTFKENFARRGGGMYIGSVGGMVINCTFSSNIADSVGGGMCNLGSVLISRTVTNCRFVGNSAHETGGGMSNLSSSSPTVTNCTFSGNTASNMGGGMSNAGSPKVINCTFSKNSAFSGGGMANTPGSPTVTNCVLWRNSDSGGKEESAQLTGGASVVNYCIVQGGWTGAGGIGVVDADPLFVNPEGADNIPGTEDDDLRLMPGSLAMDSGNNEVVPADLADIDGNGDTGERLPLDLGGNTRFVDDPVTPDTGFGAAPIVDMGAFEFQPDCNSNGIPDYLDLSDGTSTDCNNDNQPDKCDIDANSTAPGGPFFCTLNCDSDCNDSGIPDECEVPQSCEPGVDCPVTSNWIGQSGLWNDPPDNLNWCLPESPNNNPNASFSVTVAGPESVVTLNISPTIASLSLLDGATVQVSDASGANARTLVVDTGITNMGLFLATGRERLVLDAPVIDQVGECAEGGSILATDGIEGLGEQSDKSIVEINGAVVRGGSVGTSGEHSEVHLIGGAELVDTCITGVVVPDGQTGKFGGVVTNDDVLTVRGASVNTRLEPVGPLAVLQGTGCVRLTDRNFARLGDFKQSFINGPMHRIEGTGIIFGGLANQGTVSAQVPGEPLNLLPPGRKTNAGLFLATAGGTLRIADDVTGSGSYRADGGTIRLVPGDDSASIQGTTLEALGDGGGMGTVELNQNAAVELFGAVIVRAGGLYDARDGTVTTAANFVMDGTGVVPCPDGTVRGGRTPPVTKIKNSGRLALVEDMTLINATDISVQSSISVSVGGDFDNRSVCPGLFDWIDGGLTLNGTAAQRFEAAGRDFGPALLGFGTGADTNFAMGTIEVSPGRSITVEDAFDNDQAGQEDCREALYVRTLILRAGSIVTADHCRVYFEHLMNEGATIIEHGCGGFIQLPLGDIDGNGRADLQDWAALSAYLSGPDLAASETGRRSFDFDADGDVDLADAGWFQRLMNRP